MGALGWRDFTVVLGSVVVGSAVVVFVIWFDVAIIESVFSYAVSFVVDSSVGFVEWISSVISSSLFNSLFFPGSFKIFAVDFSLEISSLFL